MTSRPVLPEQIAAISYEIADNLEPDMARAFLAVIQAVADAMPLARLELLLEAGDITGIMIEFESILSSVLTGTTVVEDFVDVHRQVFTASLQTALLSATAVPVFDSVLVSTMVRIEQHASSLILGGVSRDMTESIGVLLRSGLHGGLGAEAMARLIRTGLPLIPRHELAVVRFIGALRDRGASVEEAMRHAEAYAGRLATWRAQTIARTEVIHASMAAQVSLWRQMVKEGILIDERTWMEWMVTEDDALCEFCAPMDEQRVRVNDWFLSTHKGFPNGKPKAESTLPKRKTPLRPDPRSVNIRKAVNTSLRVLPKSKRVLHPPLHPRCRCTLVLRFE